MGEPLSDKVFKLLNAHPWQETLELLVLHASRKMNRLRWRNSWKGSPPEGIQNIDIVQEVVAKTFEGTRRWDPEKNPDLYAWLQNQVDSEISNLVQSQKNKKDISEFTLFDPTVLERVDISTPEALLLQKEEETRSDTILLQLLEFLKEEPDLLKVVEAFMAGAEGLGKRAELARYLGIQPTELDARNKRLARRMVEFRNTLPELSLEMKGGGLL